MNVALGRAHVIQRLVCSRIYYLQDRDPGKQAVYFEPKSRRPETKESNDVGPSQVQSPSTRTPGLPVSKVRKQMDVSPGRVNSSFSPFCPFLGPETVGRCPLYSSGSFLSSLPNTDSSGTILINSG